MVLNFLTQFNYRYLTVKCELQKTSSWPALNKELPILPITPSIENFICESDEDENIEELNKKIYDPNEAALSIKEKGGNNNKGIRNLSFVPDEEPKSESIITKF